MKNKSKISKLTFIFVLFSLSIIQSCSKSRANFDDYDAEVITSWNQKVMEIAVAEDHLLTLKGVRTAAMMHTAMHGCT